MIFEKSSEFCFPGIALLKENISKSTENRIITVRTEDNSGRTADCYGLFIRELNELSIQTGIELAPTKEITVPYSEDRAKEKSFLKELFHAYPEKNHIYMDITYGTKLTAIEMFSSLCYAETALNCNIKSVVYGKYPFDGGNSGELFDVSELYHTVRFMETAAHMNKNCFLDLIEQLLC